MRSALMNGQGLTDPALNQWRMVGDEPADTLARALLTAYGVDEHDETVVLTKAVRAVVAGAASKDDDVLEWLTAGCELPDWADDDLIAAGQEFFSRWPMPIATTLFCAALPMAYAAPHGAAVMVATSRLSQRHYVARRLAETGHMVFDVMDPTSGPDGGGASGEFRRALHPGSQGYVTVRGVRLLHGLVRQALLARHGELWPSECGMPINQEDLLGTLLTFTVTVLDGLDRLGVPVSQAEAQAYVHTWSVVGSVLGIDASLLPKTVPEARDLALMIARRQVGPSSAGTALADQLLYEMRLAMPVGCRGLPRALVHRLVPEVAELLQVPPAGFLWRGIVDSACALARAGQRIPRLRELASGPGALVGGSMLRMHIERQEQSGGPSHWIDAGELLRREAVRRGWSHAERRTERRRRRGDTIGVGPHVGPTRKEALAALPDAVELPVEPAEVSLIASEGFPLWEPVDVMVRRNRCITLAYADLSRHLAELIAGGDDILDANWCTFAAWSSRTIGSFIEDIPPAAILGREPVGRPGPVPGASEPLSRFSIEELTRQAMLRTNGSSFRTLAAGNRVVFLEIGLSIATFIEAFRACSALESASDKRWEACWTAIEGQLEGLTMLDPSWMLTPSPKPDDLRLGLRQYFEALSIDDRELRSQHVLAGNLLLAAYEQRRVDGYVWAALALFTERAMRRLICDRTGAVGGVRRWPSCVFALLMTRRMELHLPGEVLSIDQPIPPPIDPGDRWEGLATDAGVTLPLLQALITRYQLAVGRRPLGGCRNWTSFDQRMRTIGNLFRSRQRQANLFGDPFTVVDRGT